MAAASPALLPETVATAAANASERTSSDNISWAPTAKVSAGMLAGALTTFLVIFIGPYLKKNGFEFTAEATAALTTLLTFVVQYWVPERR